MSEVSGNAPAQCGDPFFLNKPDEVRCTLPAGHLGGHCGVWTSDRMEITMRWGEAAPLTAWSALPTI